MIVTSSVWENLFYFGSLAIRLAKKNIVWIVRKAKTDILLAHLVCFEVQCLPRSAHLKICLIFVIPMTFQICISILNNNNKFLYQLPLVCLLLCFLLLLLLFIFSSTWWKQYFVKSACVSSCRWIHFPSSISFVNLTSSCSLIPQKKNVFFHIHEITWVVVLYTTLRFVKGVYKPHWACVGWASVTESCLKAYMGIKHTCLDVFSLGHPKLFKWTLDIISSFILAISNTVNLFPSVLCCSPWKR